MLSVKLDDWEEPFISNMKKVSPRRRAHSRPLPSGHAPTARIAHTACLWRRHAQGNAAVNAVLEATLDAAKKVRNEPPRARLAFSCAPPSLESRRPVSHGPATWRHGMAQPTVETSREDLEMFTWSKYAVRTN